MNSINTQKLDTCGCCEEKLPQIKHHNRPGQPALTYRLGTHSTFLCRMLARLPCQEISSGPNSAARPLATLTTRTKEDPAIALLDAWATVADVLTFYQERIANEGYLRTATERPSVLELARTIGYELNPGVAASTFLAFTVEDALGAPGRATIDEGVKVMSVPKQDQKPQIFETVEKIEARAEWNALKPRMTEPKIPGFGAKEVYLKGVETGLKPGDGLLFVGEERKLDPGSERWDFRRVKTVTANPEAGYTKVTWDEGLGWKGFNKTVMPAQNPKVYAFRQRAALFGHNAPDWRAMPDNVKKNYITPAFGSGTGLYAEYFNNIDPNVISPKVIRIDSQVNFDWGTGSPHTDISSDNFSARWTGFVEPKFTGIYTFYTLSDDGVRLWVDGKLIINNWTDHPQTEDSGTIKLVAGRIYDIKLEYYEHLGGAIIKLFWSGPNQPKEIIPTGQLYPPDFYQNINEWPNFTLAGLYAEYFNNIDPNATSPRLTRIDSQVNFDWGTGSPHTDISSDNFSACWTGFVEPKFTGIYTFYTLSDDGVRLWVDGKLIINNWTDHPQKEDSGTIKLVAGRIYDIKLEYYERLGGAIIKLFWLGPNQPKEIIPASQLYSYVHLDSVYPQIMPSSWLILSTPKDLELYKVETVDEDSQSNFTLTAKTTRVTLKGENLSHFNNKLRETVVFAQSELLEMAEVPRTDVLAGNSIELDRLVQGLERSRKLIVSGKRSHPATRDASVISEMVVLDKVNDGNGRSKLILKEKMLNSYDPSSVVIYANVVLATHGETVHEVLGSGDGSRANQSFVLKKPYLTYVSAPTPSGSKNTLGLYVNDMLWEEVPMLYGLDPHNQNYIVRIDNDAKARVIFGDGKNGARLPSGTENVKAIYRSGIGLEGEVDAGSLTILQTRPLGIREVTNPPPATGASEPEKLEKARINAPRSVLTFGRIVSLRDFEDFARSFSGIGKAQAVDLWNGERRVVYITVADPNGKIIDSTNLKTYLFNAIKTVCDPIQQVEIKDFVKLTFSIEAKILVDPRYQYEEVKKSAEKALLENFSFDKRDFGQSITAAEILEIIHDVKGILAVDLDKLTRDNGVTNKMKQPPAILPAHKVRLENGEIKLAELLLINPAGITLTRWGIPT